MSIIQQLAEKAAFLSLMALLFQQATYESKMKNEDSDRQHIPGITDLFDISQLLSTPFVLKESESQHQHLELLTRKKNQQ